MTAKSNKRPSEPRRANKPLMEKRRRARINQSLAALKTLILDSAKAENTKHSKLEKADILELTVRHFQRHRSLDVKAVNQYKAGYVDCVREVQRYLETPDAQTMTLIDAGVRQRLLRHLDNCIAEVDVDIRNANTSTPNSNNGQIEERLVAPTANLNSEAKILEEVNNNSSNNNRPEPKQLLESAATLNNKIVKNYDGNFVLLLPEHYVQLANALGVNLRPHHPTNDVTIAVTPATNNVPSISGTSDKCHTMEDESMPKLNGSNNGQREAEKPLDYSKNNEGNGDMWRPW